MSSANGDFYVNMNSFKTSSQIIKSFEYVNYVITCYNINALIKMAKLYAYLDTRYGKIVRVFASDLINISNNDMPNEDLKETLHWNNDGTFYIETTLLRKLYEYTIILKSVLDLIVNEFIATDFISKSFTFHVVFPEIKNDSVLKLCLPFTKLKNLKKNENTIVNYIQDICSAIFIERDNKMSRFRVNIYYNSSYYNKEYIMGQEHKELVKRICNGANGAGSSIASV